MSQKLQLIDLPNELIEIILFLICLENARDVQACRLTCRTLNMATTGSGRVRYLMRAALPGVYNPLVDDTAAPTVSERMAELCAWDDAWRGIGDILREREPDACIVPPDVDILDEYEFAPTSMAGLQIHCRTPVHRCGAQGSQGADAGILLPRFTRVLESRPCRR